MFSKWFGRGKDAVKTAVQARELGVANPLELKVGDGLQIQMKELSSLDFRVTEVIEFKMTLGGHAYTMTDYCIAAVCHDPNNEYCSDGRVSLRLRFQPKDDPIPGDEYWAYILWPERDHYFDEKLIEVMWANPTGFTYPEDKDLDTDGWKGGTWKRDNPNIKDPFYANVTSLRDDDRSGTVDADEVVTRDEEFYDFYYAGDDSDCEDNVVFIHVDQTDEDDGGNGFTTHYCGFSIRPELIEKK